MAEEAARAAEQQAQAARERRAKLSTQLEEERAARATAEADLARERARAAEMEEQPCGGPRRRGRDCSQSLLRNFQ